MMLTLLYGEEFWETLEALVPAAKKRVMFMSGFMKPATYQKYRDMVPENVPLISMTRDDNKDYYGRPVKFPDEVILIPNGYFHGKIYLIDDVIIIGSQNLYDAGKQGEFSVKLEMGELQASLTAYQALMQIVLNSPTNKAEPIESDFLNSYESGCPFCGRIIEKPVLDIPPYGECVCCDGPECGFGIRVDNMELIHRTRNLSYEDDKFSYALLYLSVFNFFSRIVQAKAIDIFGLIGLQGNIFQANPLRRTMEFTEV